MKNKVKLVIYEILGGKNMKKSVQIIKKFLLFGVIAIILSLFCVVIWQYLDTNILSAVFLGIIAWIIFIWKSNKIPLYKDEKGLCKDDYIRICNARELWKVSQGIWNSVHLILVILPIFFTVFIIYISSTSNTDVSSDVIFYSILSLILTIIDLLINPVDIARGHRKAFEKINHSLFLYDNGYMNGKELIDNVAECESYLSNNVL